MLSVARKSFFSRDFSVSDGGALFADVEFPGWSDRAYLSVDRMTYEARREGWFGGRYVLERGGSELARAETTGFLRTSYVVTAGSRTLLFARKGVFRSAFVLSENGREVGEIARRGFWRSTTAADLPTDLDQSVRAFLVWLAVVRWRADEGAAAAAG